MTECVAAIIVAQFFRLGGEVKRLAQSLRIQHRQSFFVIGVESARGGRDVQQARLFVDELLEFAALFERGIAV